MKVVLFTPAIKTSAIGRAASLVCRALVHQGHNVSVVRTELKYLHDKAMHDFGVDPISWSDAGRIGELSQQADLMLYQIGDNYEFHSGCLEWLSVYPGVVCLHDYFLGHLFSQWSQSDPARARTIVRTWYGEETARYYFGHPNTDAFIEGTRESAPLTEWMCSMAVGVITHSSWGIERVLNSCPGPVHVVPLPYDRPMPGLDNAKVERDLKNETFNILTVGHVNSNKRAAQVIAAIANSELLRQQSVYHLVGHILPKVAQELSALARKRHVNLVISGEVDDAALVRALMSADVASCLRWPPLEGAAASVIEAMLCGKATIVTDAGFSSELPGSVAKKIDPENELANIQSTLEYLALNPGERDALGARAEAWARATFSAENYALRVVEIGRAINKSKPKIDAAGHFVKLMSGWNASEALMKLSDTTAPLNIFSDGSA